MSECLAGTIVKLSDFGALLLAVRNEAGLQNELLASWIVLGAR